MACLVTACAPKPDLEKAKKQILALEAKQRAYHFGKNAKGFAKMFSQNFLSINKGRIEHPDERQSFGRFNAYFNSVDFVKWDDKTPPIVRFSDDASVAYVAVNRLVILKPKNSNNDKLDTTNFAWLAVYKKTAEGWKIDCVTSTNQ